MGTVRHSGMGNVTTPDAASATELRANLDQNCAKAGALIAQADVMILLTGAGFSADSGLAVYADVASVPAYSARELTYMDLCMPHWQQEEPALFWGFWGGCFNDYRKTAPHEGYQIIRS